MNVRTGDGGHTLDKGHTGLNRISDCFYGADVADNSAHISRQLAAGNHATQSPLDEHLFAALGVLGLSGQHFDALFACNLFFHQGDGIGLVVLNDDDTLGRIHRLHHSLQAVDDGIGILQKHPVVSGEHGLTFAGVNKYSFDRLAGLQLYIGGEACAAHTNDARILYDLHDFIGGQLF